MDINKQIQEATDSFIEEKLPTMVKEKVSKMVDGVLEDIFRSYSDTAKQIKTKIEEGLDINLQNFGLVDYNALVSKAISDRLAFLVQEQTIKPVLQMVDDAVRYQANKSVKISEIHEMVREQSMEDHDADAEGSFSFYVTEEDGWFRVSIDVDGEKSEKDCAISFLVSKSSGAHIFCFKAGNFMQQKEDITPARLTMLDRLELKVFRLYAAQCQVIMDENYFDNEWNRYS